MTEIDKFRYAADLCFLKQAGFSEYLNAFKPFDKADSLDASIGMGLGGALLGGLAGAGSAYFDEDDEDNHKDALKRGLVGALAGGAGGAAIPQGVRITSPLAAKFLHEDINNVYDKYEDEMPWLLKKLNKAVQSSRQENIERQLPNVSVSDLRNYFEARGQMVDQLNEKRLRG